MTVTDPRPDAAPAHPAPRAEAASTAAATASTAATTATTAAAPTEAASTAATTTTTAAAPTEAASTEAASAELKHGPGRWIDNWNPENATQWAREGKAIASRNLRWSIFAEFLGFVVWQLWSVVVVSLPAAGFTLSTGEIFWLISMPSLVGATLRIPYTFMVPRFGGRNWTIVSAALLLIPSIGLAVAVSNPATPFGVLLVIAALAGFGGGNFASSMANITYFYPAAQKGYALGLNAAGGNLGASVAQFVVPIVITVGAAATLNLPLAGLIWVPLIIVAMVGAYLRMDNLSNAKSDITASLAALKEPHLWVMAVLYIGTFGSFIGFAGVFPKLLADTFPDFTGIAIGSATVTLAFMGALVGSLARPYGGKLADRFGGTVITMGAFTVMGLGILSVILTLPMQNFAVFLACFLVLFAAAGIGNGSTYRMIPTIFTLRANGGIGAQRKAAAALGLISAIGAYGGFFIPQLLGFSKTTFGSYTPALGWFALAYVAFLAITASVYLTLSKKSGTRI